MGLWGTLWRLAKANSESCKWVEITPCTNPGWGPTSWLKSSSTGNDLCGSWWTRSRIWAISFSIWYLWGHLEHRAWFQASLVLKKTLANWFSRCLYLGSWIMPEDTVLSLCVLKTNALITVKEAFKAWFLLSCYRRLTLLHIKTSDYF